jgi:hypothetical protein
MGFIKDIFASMGLPIGMLAPLVWLYSQGHWALMLLAAALMLGGYVYWLGKRLPWHQTKFTDLSELNDQKAKTYASLQRRLARAGQAMPSASAAPSGSPANNAVTSRWHASVGWAEAWFSRQLGADIWTYAGFNKLLLFALAYPLVFMLLTWLLTDVGQMGEAVVLPSYGTGWLAFFKRFGVFLLMLLPFLPFVIAKCLRPKWLGFGSTTKNNLKVFASSVVLFILSQEVLRSIELGAVLGAVVGAVVLAVAVAGAVVGAVTVLGAGAVAVADADAVAGAVAVAGASAGASAVVVFFAIDLLVDAMDKGKHQSSILQCIAVVAVTMTLAILVCAVTYFAPQWTTDTGQLSASKLAFTIMLFMGILPLCNALFDWLSVGFTRYCLRSMASGKLSAAVLVVADIVIGLLLTVGLFALVLKILQWMQLAGWGIDAKAVVTAFRANPLDPQVSWIAMLALTNMLPTLVHLVITFWGLFTAQIRLPRADVAVQVHSLLGLLDANGRFVGQATPNLASSILDTRGQAIAAKPVAVVSHQNISSDDLNALFNYLYVDYWLVLLTIAGVVIALWSQYLAVLGWFLGLFL